MIKEERKPSNHDCLPDDVSKITTTYIKKINER